MSTLPLKVRALALITAGFGTVLDAQSAEWQNEFSHVLKIYDEGKYSEAVPLLQDLVKREPGNPKAHYKLGVAFNKTGQKLLAEQEFRAVIRLREDYPNAHFNLGVTLTEENREPEALPFLERAVQLDPEDAPAAFQFGNALFNVDRFSEAEVQFRAAIRFPHDFPNAHFNLGQTLIKRGRCAEAVPLMQRATEVDVSDSDAWMRYSYAYECLHKWTDAADVW